MFFEYGHGRIQSTDFPRGILVLTSDSQTCILLLDCNRDNCVVLAMLEEQQLVVHMLLTVSLTAKLIPGNQMAAFLDFFLIHLSWRI